ncbi:MAG: hypothetical protein OXR62_05535 [Ahrensia sp.]|nr:hypothetical protein [Ahrensia sp.]
MDTKSIFLGTVVVASFAVGLAFGSAGHDKEGGHLAKAEQTQSVVMVSRIVTDATAVN